MTTQTPGRADPPHGNSHRSGGTDIIIITQMPEAFVRVACIDKRRHPRGTLLFKAPLPINAGFQGGNPVSQFYWT